MKPPYQKVEELKYRIIPNWTHGVIAPKFTDVCKPPTPLEKGYGCVQMAWVKMHSHNTSYPFCAVRLAWMEKVYWRHPQI